MMGWMPTPLRYANTFCFETSTVNQFFFQQTIPLDPPQTGFGIGASLLNAAIGVTRSVTSFLGLALQVVIFQTI
jgi:hypothetical protein